MCQLSNSFLSPAQAGGPRKSGENRTDVMHAILQTIKCANGPEILFFSQELCDFPKLCECTFRFLQGVLDDDR
jgi:hypothetical protein